MCSPGVRELHIVDNHDELVDKFASILENVASDAINNKGKFKIGLSGGSSATYFCKAAKKLKTDWEKWILFFCDERVVPHSHKDSNYGVYMKELLGNVPINESQFVTIEPGLSAQDAAKEYIQKMSVHFEPDDLPKFDMLLLGLGPDGHTCSLFPGHPLLDESSVWVAYLTDSPKPPPSRITLTFPVINNADNCLFILTGEEKAAMFYEVYKEQNQDLPAARVGPPNGKTYWILDKPAAKLL